MNNTAWAGIAVVCFLLAGECAADGQKWTAQERTIDALEKAGVRVHCEGYDSARPAIGMTIFVSPWEETSVDSFARIEELKTLREAKLTGARIDDRYVEHLAALPNLEMVEFVDTRITDKSLEALSHLKKLRRLIIAFCPKITDKGVEHLRNLASLEELVLTDVPGLTGSGLVAVRAMSKLKELDISWTSVGDEGIAVIARHPALQKLACEECSISDRSLKAFEAMPNLRELVVDDTRITKTGIDAFRKAHPAVKVSY